MVSEIRKNELQELLELYLFLHEESAPEITEYLMIRPYAMIKNVVTHKEYRKKRICSRMSELCERNCGKRCFEYITEKMAYNA